MKTLFGDARTVVNSLKFMHSLNASEQFITCADNQLTAQFIEITGIKPSKDVCFSLSEHYIGAPIYTSYIKPNNYVGRKLMIKLYVKHNWNPITIFWKSKTNRDYRLHDIEIDCSDIEFGFENLDKDLYLSQLSG
jgi:hypothetical protein